MGEFSQSAGFILVAILACGAIGFLVILLWRIVERSVLIPVLGGYIGLAFHVAAIFLDLAIVGAGALLIVWAIFTQNDVSDYVRWAAALFGTVILTSRIPENYSQLLKERSLNHKGVDPRGNDRDYTPSLGQLGLWGWGSIVFFVVIWLVFAFLLLE